MYIRLTGMPQPKRSGNHIILDLEEM